jgi:Domain of unknown function (DUF4350)
VTATTAPARSGTGWWVGAGALVLALVAIVVLSSRTPDGEPFDPRSSAPDGYRAVTLLLRDRGATVRSTTSAALDPAEFGPGDALVVPVPAYASEAQQQAMVEIAARGATVVFGEPLAAAEDELEFPGGLPLGFGWVDRRTLAEEPARAVQPGLCDIAELAALGAVDAAFVDEVTVPGSERSCYGSGERALVHERAEGSGRVVTLGSPYLWANARLQPAKEDGGQPLDNAATALALLGPSGSGAGPGVDVVMVAARPAAEVAAGGSRDPIELLPFPVKLAIVQLIAAFGLYVWFRARRLGRPLTEAMPVEIAGSELVVAVGDLLRRKGNESRAAVTLRAEARRTLGARLGVPPTATVDALCAVVAARSGRDPAEVRAALADAPVADADTLVRLARTLDALRQEVLDVPTAR